MENSNGGFKIFPVLLNSAQFYHQSLVYYRLFSNFSLSNFYFRQVLILRDYGTLGNNLCLAPIEAYAKKQFLTQFAQTKTDAALSVRLLAFLPYRLISHQLFGCGVSFLHHATQFRLIPWASASLLQESLYCS